MIHPHALLFSATEDLTIGQIKDNNYDPTVDVSTVLERSQKRGISAVVDGQTDYHYRFSQIQSSPYIVYYIGDISLLNRQILGIVGPRKHSDFAKSKVQTMISQARKYNLVTISGLATGVDQLAHQYSLDCNIPTIAVLGGGFDYYLKSVDRNLIHKIVDGGGLILSEFKFFQTPQTYTFPQRNRIIAGLSDVIFLPEASQKSGSLITVEFAQKLSKPIYGTPNLDFPTTSLGLHQQIQNGGVRALLDIPKMLETHFSEPDRTSITQAPLFDIELDQDSRQLLDYLQGQISISIHGLLQKGFPQDKIYPALARLEMENLVFQQEPGVYKLL